MSAFGRSLARAALSSFEDKDASARVWWSEDGDPQLVSAIGEEPDARWASTATRNAVARDQQIRKVPSRTTVGRAVALYPMSAGTSRGVLEVQADGPAIEQVTDSLASLAELSAPVPAVVENRRRQGVIAAAFELGRSLSSSTVADEAARKVVRFLARTFDTPVVLWRADEAAEMRLVAQSGVPVQARRALRALRVVPLWDSLSSVERSLQTSAVEMAIDRSGELFSDEHLVLFVGAVSSPEMTTAAMSAAFLVHALSRVGSRVFEAAAQRQLDLAVAVAAHEMRAPLLGVEAALGILLGRTTMPPPDRDLLRRSRADVRRLLSETKHLLVPISGRGISTSRPFDLLSVTKGAVDLVRQQSKRDDVTVSGETGLIVRGTVATLRRAVTNIVRNALVHAGGAVQVVVAREGANALIRVSDAGPGIARRERATIFDPFVRGSSGRKGEGSGLGLFVARLAVESHGGSLSLRSGSRGSIFTIHLPLAGEGEPSSSAS